MLKLLIVDDEPLERDAMENFLDWSAMGISEVIKAKNGFDALRKSSNFCPDIMITDVKMPGMTGLVLAEKLRDLYPKLKVIFSSGYDDVEFIRNALRLSAYEYILKPVNKNELENAFIRVLKDINNENKESYERESLLSMIESSKDLYSEKMLDDIIYGTINKGQLCSKVQQGLLEKLKANELFTTILIEHDDYLSVSEEIGYQKSVEFTNDLVSFLNLTNTFGYFQLIKKLSTRRYIILFAIKTKNTADDISKNIEGMMEELIKWMYAQKRISITVSKGLITDTIEKVHDSYDLNCRIMNTKMFVGKGIILTKHSPAQMGENEAFPELLSNIDYELAKCVRNLDIERLSYLLSYLFDTIEATGITDIMFVQNICINAISRLQIIINEMNESVESVFGIGTALWYKLLNMETILDIRQWMKGVFFSVIDFIRQKELSNCRKIVSKVIDEIELNYDKDIILKEIAVKLFYSPNHLGYIFKQETGKGFNDYLTEYRMKKACEMLDNPTLKIYEIALKVTYKNSNAFSLKFKEYYGITPKKYRENKFI